MSNIADIVKDSHMIDGRLVTPKKGNDLRELYTIFRRAFLDGEIKYFKPIAFKISAKSGFANVNAVGRSTVCLESQMDVARLVSNMSFINCRLKLVVVNCNNMLNDAMSVTYRQASRNYKSGEVSKLANETDIVPIRVLNEKAIMPRAINDGFELSLLCSKDNGVRDVSYNVRTLRTKFKIKNINDYFPIATDYRLSKYIRVLPFNGYTINYELDGISKDVSLLWEEYVDNIIEMQTRSDS